MENKIYASFFSRLIAFIIDFLVLFIIGALVCLYLLSFSNSDNFVGNIILFIIYLLSVHIILAMVVNTYLISTFGGTIGKLISGIKVENEDGTNLTFKQAFFREYIAKMASSAFLGLGYFWLLKTPKKQTWHDMICSTVVVKKKSLILGLVTLLLFLVIKLYLCVHIATSLIGLSKSMNTSTFNETKYNIDISDNPIITTY